MKVLIYFALFLFPFIVSGQKFKPDKPNIYFLIDTINTGPNNRIYQIVRKGNFIHYEIFCPCYPDHQHSGFISDLTPRVLTKKEIDTFKFISLKDFLLKLSTEQENVGYKNNIFFVEKVKSKYYMYLVNMYTIFRNE